MFNASLVDIPRPYIDSIDTLVEALGIACLALEHPLHDHTLALITDNQRRGIGLVRDTPLTHLSIHSIVGQCSQFPDAHSLVLVSVRTSSPINPSDIELLHQFTSVVASAGLYILDWVVVGRGGLYCPRSIAGSPDPWSTSAASLY
jgi:hypothetical protein